MEDDVCVRSTVVTLPSVLSVSYHVEKRSEVYNALFMEVTGPCSEAVLYVKY